MQHKLPLVVFSHLRWDSVYQRPHHLVSRLSAWRRVIVIEEPCYDEAPSPYWELSTPSNNVLVARPCTPNGKAGFDDSHNGYLIPMLRDLLEQEEVGPHVAWLYTPMALPLAQALRPQAVVYDCMDELSAFKFAPTQLREREARLMEWSDVVLTGGPSLYRARVGQHRNLYCFPSSVDEQHFSAAASMSEAADQRPLPHPRLGFFGVIDERIDLQLLDAVAGARPEWQLVMVGPLAKISEADLPVRPNIHYMGKRAYEELPSYLAGWDVCLLPFARNEATRFISPTKTLEYMAADKPIVSTPIVDVEEPYGEIVYLADTAEQFVAACEEALAAAGADWDARRSRMQAVLSRTSWDATAARMNDLIENALLQKDVSGSLLVGEASELSGDRH